MKKVYILIIALLCIVVLNTQAQISIGATVGGQIPMGSFADACKVGFGFNVVGKYMLKENIAVGLNLGYQRFGTKLGDMEGVSVAGSWIPVTALFEYHFGTGKAKPYIGADAGLYRFTATAHSGGMSVSASVSDFGFAPVFGITSGINDNLSFCANVKYNCVLTEGEASSWIGINAGLIFKIK